MPSGFSNSNSRDYYKTDSMRIATTTVYAWNDSVDMLKTTETNFESKDKHLNIMYVFLCTYGHIEVCNFCLLFITDVY